MSVWCHVILTKILFKIHYCYFISGCLFLEVHITIHIIKLPYQWNKIMTIRFLRSVLYLGWENTSISYSSWSISLIGQVCVGQQLTSVSSCLNFVYLLKLLTADVIIHSMTMWNKVYMPSNFFKFYSNSPHLIMDFDAKPKPLFFHGWMLKIGPFFIPNYYSAPKMFILLLASIFLTTGAEMM